jgi:ribosomal protein S18 acetylase RimI-like enzyme
MSLIVASENAAARRLYVSLGFEDVGALPVVPHPRCPHSGTRILMIKRIDLRAAREDADARAARA